MRLTVNKTLIALITAIVGIAMYVIRAEAKDATREVEKRITVQEALLPGIKSDVAEIKGDVKHIQYLLYRDRFDRTEYDIEDPSK
jgi:hypothetical protein